MVIVASAVNLINTHQAFTIAIDGHRVSNTIIINHDLSEKHPDLGCHRPFHIMTAEHCRRDGLIRNNVSMR
jgi:hypothetical protein